MKVFQFGYGLGAIVLVAASFGGCLVAGADDVNQQSTADGPEPADDGNAALAQGSTVAQAVSSSCETSVIKGLSQQIIDEGNCITPGAYSALPDEPNLSLGGAVFPYLEAPARDALVKALKAYPSRTMSINSMLRNVAQQYLLYAWYEAGRCGISLAAKPGSSNHETGLAFDVNEYSAWRTELTAVGFKWFGSADVVHYDYVGSGAKNYKGLDILAFQKLWNLNNPSDTISEDGGYGPQTEARIKKAPVDGFAIGPSCDDGSGGSGGAPTTSATTSSSNATSTSSGTGTGSGGGSGSGSGQRGLPQAGPWTSFYGGADGVDLQKVASTFKIVNIDADPDSGNFTASDIATMKGSGNRVISYLNVGSCENFRSYYSTAPAGHASCVSSGALTTAYDGYSDEKWANLSNVAYRDLMVNYVAPRLVAMGVDGFFLDNLEVVEHGANNSDGPCDSACSQGGLDLVYELRQAFPDMLIVMQNATSNVTLNGASHGVSFPSLLDGISHEEIYSDGGDAGARSEMLAWKAKSLVVNGRPFWIGAEDYVGACSASEKNSANAIYSEAQADGFNEYVTDDSGSQQTPCYW